jgi:hypothetical protein
MRQQDTQQTCQKYGTIVAIIWWHIINKKFPEND